jgi:hypothetical protein
VLLTTKRYQGRLQSDPKDQEVVVLEDPRVWSCSSGYTTPPIIHRPRWCHLLSAALFNGDTLDGSSLVLSTPTPFSNLHSRPLESMRVIAPLVPGEARRPVWPIFRSVMRLRHSKTKGTALSFREGDFGESFKTGTLIDYAFKSMTSVSGGLRQPLQVSRSALFAES